ncbi:MAG: hypothetical protein ACI91J_001372 [Yoonia sp.]|jgi:hypothetical protein
MRLASDHIPNRIGTGDAPCARRGERAFTFAEILAAMFFLALVIPVAMKGITIASKAGTVASRKATATQLGDALLNELVITDEWRSGSNSGTFEEPNEKFSWEIESSAWDQPGMTELTIRVSYLVRDLQDEVRLTTLVSEEDDTSDQETETDTQ